MRVLAKNLHSCRRHEGVWGSKGLTSLIFFRGTRWRSVVNSTPRQLHPLGKSPSRHWIGGWMAPRPGRDVLDNWQISCLCWKSKPGTSFYLQTAVTPPNVTSYISGVIPCRFVDRYHCFGGICCLHLPCRRVRLIYETTRRHKPKDHNLNIVSMIIPVLVCFVLVATHKLGLTSSGGELAE
jgi:hypothetical protein